MTIKYKSNLTAGIISIIFSVALFFIIPLQIGEDYSQTYGITSKTIPYVIMVLFLICGVALIFQSVIQKKDVVKQLEVKKELKALGFLVIFIIYSIAFKYSFLISTLFLGVVTLAFTGTKRKLFYTIVVIYVILLYLIFTQVLHVDLP
jgi:hypothetical protein